MDLPTLQHTTILAEIAASAAISAEGGGADNYIAGAAVIPLSLLIAWAAKRGNLKEEPLKLLSEKGS